jgi:hypothetical protein
MNKKRRTDLKLSECWLYAVNSPADLARRLSTRGNKLTVKDLRALSEDVGNFRLFTLTNDKGKSRAIQWPKRRLQSPPRGWPIGSAVLPHIVEAILNHISDHRAEVPGFITGSLPGGDARCAGRPPMSQA